MNFAKTTMMTAVISSGEMINTVPNLLRVLGVLAPERDPGARESLRAVQLFLLRPMDGRC